MIAIVEDDPGMRKSIQRIVRSQGFLVRSYDSAEAFLGDEAPGASACLILDIHLGGMSGLELMKDLVRRGLRRPVIFITAMEESSYQREAEETGCSAYLRKPFEAGSLVDAIRRALEAAGPENGA